MMLQRCSYRNPDELRPFSVVCSTSNYIYVNFTKIGIYTSVYKLFSSSIIPPKTCCLFCILRVVSSCVVA
ncbi:hypothetical protein ACA910_017840 [Epithemia clementina (nom. ined.)]